MCIGRGKVLAVGKMPLEWHVIPLANLFRVQVKYDRQCIKLVEAGSYIPVLNVGKAAQVNNEIGSPPLTGQLIARPLDVPVR
jgi:hypothetical protein